MGKDNFDGVNAASYISLRLIPVGVICLWVLILSAMVLVLKTRQLLGPFLVIVLSAGMIFYLLKADLRICNELESERELNERD